MAGKTGFNRYKFRQHVIFIDENQCEISGVVIQETEFDDRLALLIELDKVNPDDPHERNQHYHAWMMKRK